MNIICKKATVSHNGFDNVSIEISGIDYGNLIDELVGNIPLQEIFNRFDKEIIDEAYEDFNKHLQITKK